MKIAFRVDASNHIGTGHIMRCLALANLLRKHSHSVDFSIKPQKGDLISFVLAKNFSVNYLKETATLQSAVHGIDCSSYQKINEYNDAADFINQNKTADIVIVDHYHLGKEWEQTVKNKLNCTMVALDDLKRPHHCDLLLDVTLGRTSQAYNPYVPKHCKILTGCEYALLNAQFINSRKVAISKQAQEPHKLLISMGGIDNTNITLKVLTELARFNPTIPFSVTVLISSKSPFYQNVLEYIKNYPREITQLDFVENMSELILEHTIAIGAPGGSSWERACLGIPCLLIAVADNQKTICKELTQKKAAISVPIKEIDNVFSAALTKLITDYTSYRHNAFKLCDARGLYRVNFHLDTLFNKKIKHFHNCRLATTNDIQQVYLWQTQPETRRFANNINIPTYDEHEHWMKKKLATVNSYFYIIENKGPCGTPQPAGVVRLDEVAQDKYIISIYIAPEHHLKSLAIEALNFIDHVHPDCQIDATVLKGNLASQRLFSKAGYKKIDIENYQRNTIK